MDKKYDIVIISGAFGPIHRGHVRLFKGAKSIGHKVILGLNSDQWVVNQRGKVFMDWAERAEVLREFRNVDEVLSFNDSDGTALDLIIRVKKMYPELKIAFANGGNRTESNTPESGMCSAYGIDMIFNAGGGIVQSSTQIIENVKGNETIIDNSI
jgi:D-beta-D-heptose 7-phosphate kinase/D-beta-D-heptose 1-phosphate adenosyltransferase